MVTWGPLGYSRIIRIFNLIPSAKSLLPHEVAYLQVPGIGTWTSMGAFFSLAQGKEVDMGAPALP